MFKVGDQIFYPLHGLGYIEAIEEKEVLGKSIIYYIVNIPQTRMQIMIPVEKEENFGIRQLVESSVLEEILDSFQLGNTDPLMYQNQKYCTDLNTRKMKSGNIFKGTEIIRDLTRKNHLSKLGKEDTKMLEDARHMFISELMEVKCITKENATDLLDSALVIRE
ncbi:MAG: CarD family transcriptional regulator [Peptococcaceae bacterium]|nr:CarD family transcriptional regulator [Peptococcaceae bacterium]